MYCCLVTFFSLLICSSSALAQKCYRPEIPAYSILTPDLDFYSTGDVVTYRCTNDHKLTNGSTTRSCNNGTWSGTTPLCFADNEICSGTVLPDGRCLARNPDTTWNEAERTCSGNSQLLILSDQSTLTAAKDLLASTGGTEVWVGAHSERVWRWTDGLQISEFSWAVGEPNELPGRGENNIQLRMTAGYKWNDARGSDIYEDTNGWSVNKYICQYGGECFTVQDTNPKISLDGSCYVFKSKLPHEKHDGDCKSWNEAGIGGRNPDYWMTYCKDRGMNWADADAACQQSGGKLAQTNSSIASDNLIEYIRKRVFDQNERQFAGNYWIGGTFENERKWIWGNNNSSSTLEAPTITNFNSKVCGAVSRDGAVYAYNCGDRKPSLCVKDVQPKACGTPPQPPHTKTVRIPSYITAGDKMQLECDDGYMGVNQVECNCLSTGRWNEQCESSIVCRADSLTSQSTLPSAATPLNPPDINVTLYGSSTAALLLSTTNSFTTGFVVPSNMTTDPITQRSNITTSAPSGLVTTASNSTVTQINGTSTTATPQNTSITTSITSSSVTSRSVAAAINETTAQENSTTTSTTTTPSVVTSDTATTSTTATTTTTTTTTPSVVTSDTATTSLVTPSPAATAAVNGTTSQPNSTATSATSTIITSTATTTSPAPPSPAATAAAATAAADNSTVTQPPTVAVNAVVG